MPSRATPSVADLEQVVSGRHRDPYSILGPHSWDGSAVVRTFQPQAESVDLIGSDHQLIKTMHREHTGGLFRADISAVDEPYQLRLKLNDGSSYIGEDPYRFPSLLGELDIHLIGEGTHWTLYSVLGAHCQSCLGVSGVQFALWAPNARRVSVVGAFNGWDGRRHCMRAHSNAGLWDIFVPHLTVGDTYKFELLDEEGQLLPLKSDPFARRCEAPPGNASIVEQSHYLWNDARWMEQRKQAMAMDQPMSVYEVHLGSWLRGEGNSWLSYTQLADRLIQYVTGQGFTHVELLPISEHPFDGSWGYQPIGLFAPSWRFGSPDEFRQFVDRFHQAGIGLIMDWVPAHFPRDTHGLGWFDGTALYEHADPRKGAHADWGTLIFNYGRREVSNYLIANALYWIREFHIDALRVDAVASMLYLDYSRDDGEWIPNQFGGRENLEAVAFLREMNRLVHLEGGVTIAEESTDWPSVTMPVDANGLGFSYKWNMGWMNDSLAYMSEDPVNRKYHHDKLTFGLVYAFDENFILPLSHDEVVHGKGSLLARMPGDRWRQFANLRAYLGFMYGHPGKKLLFMGDEFGQEREWNHDQSLDWHLLEVSDHAGLAKLVADLNGLYRASPELYQQDFCPEGFSWINRQDGDNSIYSWIRYATNGNFVICISNFTPMIRNQYRVGCPQGGQYQEILNSDAAIYGGSGQGNSELIASDDACHELPATLELTVPPLATVFIRPMVKTK